MLWFQEVWCLQWNSTSRCCSGRSHGTRLHGAALEGHFMVQQTFKVQVNLCQKYLFSHQLTHNMTKDCSSIYKFNTWKQQAQNMRRTCCAQKMFFVFVLTFKTICVHNLFSPCSDLVVFMYWTGKSMNNFLSYCGLVDPRISASDKDLPVS